jgi:hypothetical protein
MLPVVGDLYSAFTGIIGYDPIAGVKLSDAERALAIASAFVVGGGLHLLGRMGDGVADASRLGRMGDAAGEAGVGARVGEGGATQADRLGEGIISGGRSQPAWRWGKGGPDESHAREAYDAIRASKTDVEAIARYEGLNERSVARLREVKRYLFDNPNWTGPDADIAAAWHRLRTGAGTSADRDLLRHEVAEMWYRRNVRDDYSLAHQAANRHWNWEALQPA